MGYSRLFNIFFFLKKQNKTKTKQEPFTAARQIIYLSKTT